MERTAHDQILHIEIKGALAISAKGWCGVTALGMLRATAAVIAYELR